MFLNIVVFKKTTKKVFKMMKYMVFNKVMKREIFEIKFYKGKECYQLREQVFSSKRGHKSEKDSNKNVIF